MITFISTSNPIHQLKVIQQEIIKLKMKLKPFYEAHDLLKGEDISMLENLPGFREPWLEVQRLEGLEQNIMMRLALAYENFPVNL